MTIRALIEAQVLPSSLKLRTVPPDGSAHFGTL
jgi:hypothetical protein